MGLTYDQLFPGRFIKAGEMNGKPVTLTISEVLLDTLESEDGTEKQQAIIRFAEIKREMALNKTNAQCLVAMWGQDSGAWLGKRVTLFPERDTSGMSDSGVCLRVKGSPDIKSAVTAQIKLPRRRPVTRKLVPTKAGESGFDAPAEVAVDANGEVTEPFDDADVPFGEEIGAQAIDDQLDADSQRFLDETDTAAAS